MTEIEGYRDLEVIGRGGFAIVYKARQVSVGRDVAIKLLTDPAPDDDLVRRFKRESQAVGALSWHPHIAAVVDAGSTALGQAYIVFELLSGGSLEERIEHGPIVWTDAVASMIRIADAVEAAHRSDVLHRDIKPANILVDRLGVAKLGDFGIASMQDGNKTETGMLATTIAHAAPELFDGHLASPATDVYALGSTLHELVTGLPPFSPREDDRIGAIIARIASEPPPRPDPERVPDQVATVIAHALAKQPQYRPRSAAAFGQALQQAQRDLGQPVTAMPVTDSQPVAPAAQAASAPAPDGAAPFMTAPDAAPTKASAPPAQPASGATAGTSATPDQAATRNLPFTSVPATATPTAKPFSKVIATLSVVAVLLAIGVGGLVLYQLQRSLPVVAVTNGGALIAKYEALAVTEMAPPFDARRALDRDETTYWGIEPVPDGIGIAGTSYVVKLTEEQQIVSVGISNGTSTELGRVTGVIWGTSIDELEAGGPNVVTQTIPNEPGAHPINFATTTDQIVLALTGVHNDAPNAGIAEILIQVQKTGGNP
nr:hypothetical protein [uncultured bacterium]